MLEQEELTEVAAQFGVSDVQVRRDHLISHILAAIAELDVPVTFFGGTALARTHLLDPDAGARLSEDVDLYGPRRKEVAAILDQELLRLLRREFPGTTWDPALSTVRSVDPGQLVSRDGLRVRVQLLDSEGGGHQDLAQWPTELRDVDPRYGDVKGRVVMWVPRLESFAAMKTVAWVDRHAARDLYDLAGLARIGALDKAAAELFHKAMGWRLAPHAFANLPELDWEAQLAHQTRALPTARECLEEVRQG